MNDFMFFLILFFFSTCLSYPPRTHSFIKSSVTLYNQSLYAFSTKVSVLSNQSTIYENYAWNYNLRYNTTKSLINPIEEVTFPEGITANVFSFENSTSFSSLMAFGQVTKGELLSKGELSSTFFSLNKNQWIPDVNLSSNGPTRRTGSSLLVYKNRLIIFGGIIISPNFYNRMFSRQLFSFDSHSQKWSDLTSTAAAANIPPMAFHTATLVKNKYMVIIGGAIDQSEHDDKPNGSLGDLNYSPNFLNRVFIFDLETNFWMIRYTSNSPYYSFMDHSASFLPQHKAIIILGGSDERIREKNQDLLLLNVDNWTWSKATLKGTNLTNIPRFWRASYLVGEQLFIMFGGISRNFALSYLVVDVKTWVCTEEVNAAPVSALKLGESNNLIPTSIRDYKLILGSTLGAIGGAAMAFVIVLLYRRIKGWKMKKANPLSQHEPFFLTPVWAGGIDFQDSSFAFSNSLWEMDSNYAYSTHLSILPRLQNQFRNLSQYHPIHSEGTICPRRWSVDLHHPSPKQFTEVTISNENKSGNQASSHWICKKDCDDLMESSTQCASPCSHTTLL